MSKAPKLRFKEFSEDWEQKKFKDIYNVKSGYGFKLNEYSSTGIPLIKIDNIGYGRIKWDNISYLPEEYKDSYSDIVLEKDDILLALNRPITNNKLKIAMLKETDIPAILYQRVGKIIVDKTCNKLFSYYLLNNVVFDFVLRESKGSDQPFISTEELKKVKFNIPLIEEQEKIASFFSLIDNKISLQGEKVEALKGYKKGMIQKIFSRELRFKDDEGRDYPEWKSGKVKDVITEHLYPIEKPSDAYWRVGLRSHGKGTFHEYVTDPSKVSMDKLYEVKKNMLIVNITFAWEHAIAITDANDEGKLVSHRFPTYDFNENALYDFYKYYILLPKFKYCLLNASPGGAGRNRVLNKKQFLEIDVPIPCIDEQKKIAKILNTLDNKIKKEQEKLDSLNEYKKGLLQQMFV